ncbi:MAG: hypothetical protein Q8M02_10505 [Candidatus Didemnitutus sp.]|nr:hypothetical protein [Candidatus Didemnitutus sp.]
MMHHALGRSYIRTADGAEGVELRSPRDFLEASEEVTASEAMAIRVEAVNSATAWILEASPHPRDVAVRLLVATRAFVPALVYALPTADLLAVTKPDARQREIALMRVLMAAPEASAAAARKHGWRITAALARAHRRERHTYQASATPSAVDRLRAAAPDTPAAEVELRDAALVRWVRHLWQGRSSLVEALKHFYTIARALAPERVLNMTGEEIATFFGQGRAAQSAREKAQINKRLERAGVRATTMRFQKSATACAKYAAAARGNHHRAESVRAKVA